MRLLGKSTLALLLSVLLSLGVVTPANANPLRETGPRYTVTSANPSLKELDLMIKFLVATPASDEAKAANLEAGMNAVQVPKMVYRLGLFRSPKGSSTVTGPVTHTAKVHTAYIKAQSAGRPTVNIRVKWKRIDGRWKLASSSMCSGIKAVRLPLPCTF